MAHELTTQHALNSRRHTLQKRLLILGPIDTPHTEHLAIGARERGLDVLVAGEVWGDGGPPSVLGDDIPVVERRWPTARWLRGLTARFRPDVVHANWLPNAFTYLLYGATPMVAMAWGSDVYRSSRLGQLQNRFVARYAGLVMADSADLLEQLISLGADRERAAVLNWGIDLAAFSPPAGQRAEVRRQLGLPEGRLILSPRALREVYNPRTIVAAFDQLADRHDDVQLVLKHIHADEPDLGTIRHPERVHRIGFVSYEEMAAYYQAADACVSIPSSDSSPRSVWEAMGCGTPCVVSDLPWVHELIADGRDALVVPVDAGAVAGALDDLLQAPERAARISANARRLVEQHRDRERELDRLIDVYERLAQDQPGTSRSARALQSAAASAAGAISQVRQKAAAARDR